MTTDDTNTQATSATDKTTTDTTQNPSTTDVTTTDAAQPTQRSVHELLKLKTFQGMTDAEIQSLIDYNVENAHQDETVKLAQATEIQTMNAECAAYDALKDDANSVLKKILAVPLSLGVVSQDGTVTHQ
jgi:hypothetical protein